MELAEKDTEFENRNVLEVHIRQRNEKVDSFLEELRVLMERYPELLDLIMIDTSGDSIDIVPKVETHLEKRPPAKRLMKGNIYLIKDELPDRAFELFSDVLRSQCFDCKKVGAFECEALDCNICTIECPCSDCEEHRPQGLCVTRRYPKKVAQEYLIQTTPTIWLTQMRRDDVDCINPNEIARLNSTMTSFIERSKNGVILFEGLEYLITQNSFNIILNFVQRLHDFISPSDCCVIFILDPLALEPEEVHLLKRNMIEI